MYDKANYSRNPGSTLLQFSNSKPYEIYFHYLCLIMNTRLNILLDNKFKQKLHLAKFMFGQFLSHQYSLGDSFLKSSKDFIS